jgi:aspartyl-tRNA(Asn)/glutamyl-tRNA(Gln) amidotransferase subunit C
MEVRKMAEITKEQVKHVANLARLEISDEEASMFTEHLSSIITFAEQLNEIDTDGIEPTTHVLDLKNVMRKDEPRQWITREEALKNAPDHKDGQYRVPSILE